MPTRVQNLTVSAQSESSLLVEWSPPAQINGRLLGYNVRIILILSNSVVTSIVWENKASLNLDRVDEFSCKGMVEKSLLYYRPSCLKDGKHFPLDKSLSMP